MDPKTHIHKAAGILIQDRKLLIVRSRGKAFFMAPGGKLEAGETSPQSLVRELCEEIRIDIAESDLEEFGTFYAVAAGQEDKQLRMDVYTVQRWKGDIKASSEIEEVLWVGSELPEGLELSSIFMHEVIPRLKQQGRID